MKLAATCLSVFHTPCRWLAVGALVLAGVSLPLFCHPAAAQVSGADPLRGFQDPESSTDPFSSRGDGQFNSLLELIHRANLGGTTTLPDFNRSQQQRIGEEAVNFRNLQLQLIQQETQPNASEPQIVPPAADSETN